MQFYVDPHRRRAMEARAAARVIEHQEEYIPHGFDARCPNSVEINLRGNTECGCSMWRGPRYIIQNDGGARLFKCSNPNRTHFFIRSPIYIRGEYVRDVYKYDNFYMETNDNGNISKHIPIMSTIDFAHENRRSCSNDSLQFYNKTTGVFQSLRRYIFSGYKVPLLFRTYLKQLRKSVGRDISSELYVVGVQYRTHPFDIQLGITETYKNGENNIRARIRAKREELQINNHEINKNKYMGKISGREEWYIRYINRGNYNLVAPINSHINLRPNNRARKIGLLIVGTKDELRPLFQNFSAENINSRDDAIARPIIIKLDHILKPGHTDKWFKRGLPFNINQNDLRALDQPNQISTIIGSLRLENNAKIAHRIEEIRNRSGSKSGTKSRSRSA